MTEWSAENLVHNKLKIAKEIEKHLLTKKIDVRMECACKLEDRHVRVLGMEYLRYEKVYVLVEEEDTKRINVYSLGPITNLLTSVHLSNSLYYQALSKTYPTTPQELTHIMQE